MDETLGLKVWRWFLTGAAWVVGAVVLSGLLWACGTDIKESNARERFAEQCVIDGNRVEIIYGASGWAEDAYCFDGQELVDTFDGIGTKGKR
jgi:hypothetical protein